MNLADMRTMVVERLGDESGIAVPSRTRLNAEINAAARFVGTEVGDYQAPVNHMWGTVDVTTDGTNRIFALAITGLAPQNITDFVREWIVERVNTDGSKRAMRRIDEGDELRYQGDAQDDSSSATDRTPDPILYWIRHQAGIWYIGFPTAMASGLTVRIQYTAMTTDLTADSQSFTQIPLQFHELVVQRAVTRLLPKSSADYAGELNDYNELLEQMRDSIGLDEHPHEVAVASYQEEYGV